MSHRQEKRKRDAVEGGEAHAASLEEEEEEELGRSICERTEVRGGGSLRHLHLFGGVMTT